MNLDSDALLDVHNRIRHGCHRCQLRAKLLNVRIEARPGPCESCPDLYLPSWSTAFAEGALYPAGSSQDVPPGVLCFGCRNPQTFCRSHHTTNPYLARPCLHTLDAPSLPPNLHPGSRNLWTEMVLFLLASHPASASSFVLSHAHASGHRPPASWSTAVPPVLSPLDYLPWFSHSGPGMSPPPSNLIRLHNGACLVVYLFHLHFSSDPYQ